MLESSIHYRSVQPRDRHARSTMRTIRAHTDTSYGTTVTCTNSLSTSTSYAKDSLIVDIPIGAVSKLFKRHYLRPITLPITVSDNLLEKSTRSNRAPMTHDPRTGSARSTNSRIEPEHSRPNRSVNCNTWRQSSGRRRARPFEDRVTLVTVRKFTLSTRSGPSATDPRRNVRL